MSADLRIVEPEFELFELLFVVGDDKFELELKLEFWLPPSSDCSLPDAPDSSFTEGVAAVVVVVFVVGVVAVAVGVGVAEDSERLAVELATEVTIAETAASWCWCSCLGGEHNEDDNDTDEGDDDVPTGDVELIDDGGEPTDDTDEPEGDDAIVCDAVCTAVAHAPAPVAVAALVAEAEVGAWVALVFLCFLYLTLYMLYTAPEFRPPGMRSSRTAASTMPCRKHFWNRHDWHLFRCCFVIVHLLSETQVYTRLFCTVRLKKPLQPSQVIIP